ncbi:MULTISPECIES: hypothetical protein [Aeromonas]|uniref:Uncharacterized protein n=1 Tax=Aeromonas caviae TaxID=648 RepID=A0AAJ5ZAY1_AERCA|nr:hypothetical protein [Aeromonas caviae]RWT77783.1 hypothetical protein DN604_07390 [Aeromonas caviae]WFG00333.1 hypothetical protein P5S46_21460 [Aeromonas caviae]WVM48077.1 hypothetical protein V0242_24365 [Aeromonas hydrophila]
MLEHYINAIKNLPQADHITRERVDAWLQVYLSHDKSPMSPEQLSRSLTRFTDAEGGAMLRDWLCQRQHPDFELDYSTFDAAKVIDQKLLLSPPFLMTPAQKRELTFRDHIRTLFIEHLFEQGKDVQRDQMAADAITHFRCDEIPSLSARPHDVLLIDGDRYAVFTRIPSDPKNALYSQLSFAKICQHQVVMKAAELAGYPLAGVIESNYNMMAHSFIEHHTARNPAIMDEVHAALNDGWRRVVENDYPTPWDYESLSQKYPQLSIEDIEAVRRFTVAKGIVDHASKIQVEAAEQLKASLSIPLDPTQSTTRVSLGPVEFARRTKTVIDEDNLLEACKNVGLDPMAFVAKTTHEYHLEAMLTAVSLKMKEDNLDADLLLADCTHESTTLTVQLTTKKNGTGPRLAQAIHENCREQMDPILANLNKQMSTVESHWTSDYLKRSKAQASEQVINPIAQQPAPAPSTRQTPKGSPAPAAEPGKPGPTRRMVQPMVTLSPTAVAQARAQGQPPETSRAQGQQKSDGSGEVVNAGDTIPQRPQGQRRKLFI